MVNLLILSMETLPSTTPSSQLPKAYLPSQYGFIAFFLSLLPVFIMSLSNAKVLNISDEVKKRMKLFFGIYIGLFLLVILVLTWADYTAIAGLKNFLKNHPSEGMQLIISSAYGNSADFSNISGQFQFAQIVTQNATSIIFFANIVLLVLVISYTNKNELPVYKKMFEEKQIQGRSMLLPIVVGIGFTALFYFGIPWYLEFVGNLFV